MGMRRLLRRRSLGRKSSLNACWGAELSIRPPVEDWATDFDHLDQRWIEDPFPIWAELRSSCPVAHTNRFQGVYLPTRYKDIREVAHDTQAFSSRRLQVRATPPPIKSPAPPITSDPPHYRLARIVLLPPFAPAAIVVQRRRCAPSEDLISYLVAARVDGQPLTDNHILGTLRLLLIAGIDTTGVGSGLAYGILPRHLKTGAGWPSRQ